MSYVICKSEGASYFPNVCSMRMLSLQLPFISLFCFRVGCPVNWQDLMMVLGGAVMKERDRPLRGYYQFHVKRNNDIYPQDMLH